MYALHGRSLGELIRRYSCIDELTEALLQAAGLDLVSEALSSRWSSSYVFSKDGLSD